MKLTIEEKRLNHVQASQKYRETEKGRATLQRQLSNCKSNPENRAANRRAVQKYYYKTHPQKRREVLSRFGDKCTKCGFSDWRALQIDHIHNNGYIERKSMTRKQYVNKLLTVDPKSGEYQLLCANCNWIKRYESNPNYK